MSFSYARALMLNLLFAAIIVTSPTQSRFACPPTSVIHVPMVCSPEPGAARAGAPEIQSAAVPSVMRVAVPLSVPDL